jgi:membrane protein DedA with SNARE-associated domain
MVAAVLWVPIYGSKVGEGWLYGKPVFLPDKFGWGGALILILSALIGLYLFVTWIEVRKKKSKGGDKSG